MLGTSCSAQTEHSSRRKEGLELVSALPPQERKQGTKSEAETDFQHPWAVPSRGPFNKSFVVSSVISPHLLLCRLSSVSSLWMGETGLYTSQILKNYQRRHIFHSAQECLVTMRVSDGKGEMGLRRPQSIYFSQFWGQELVRNHQDWEGRSLGVTARAQGPGRFPDTNLSWFLHYNFSPLKQNHI